MNKPVTLVITACGRPHLLKRTLESFMKYNTYPIIEGFIIEDSGQPNINDFAHEIVNFPLTIIYNEKRMGQMFSLEKVYTQVKTDYIFHCEEDWEFYNPNFIEHSFQILDDDPNITSVHLRSYEDQISRYNLNLEHIQKDFYNIVETIKGTDSDKRAGAVFFFNPGLRHRKVFMAKIPYDKDCEGTIGYYLDSIGMYSAITKNKDGYVRHIGWDEHVW